MTDDPIDEFGDDDPVTLRPIPAPIRLKKADLRPVSLTHYPYEHPAKNPPQLCPGCGELATHFVRVQHPYRPNSLGYRYIGCKDCSDAIHKAEKTLTDRAYPEAIGCRVTVEPLRKGKFSAIPDKE